MANERAGTEGWQDSFRNLAGAFGDLARAEAGVLKEDVSQWGKRFGIAVALFMIAFMTIFWLVALLLYAAVRGAEQLWGLGPAMAALAVAGGIFAMIVIMALTGYLLLRSVSGPVAAVRRRFEDHRTWWRQQVMGEAEPVLGAEDR